MTDSSGESAQSTCSSLSGLAPLEAVLFDIDRTLCDSDPVHFDALREMLQEIGFNDGAPITEEFYIEHFLGKHNTDIATFVFPDDLEKGQKKFMDDKEAMFRRMAKEWVKPIDGLNKLSKWIKDRGLKRAAVTNTTKENAEVMISIVGMSDFFQCIVLGSDCNRAKSFPGPYLKALEMLDISKDHTLICENSVSGITAGVEAGILVVGITTRSPEKLLMEATLLIKNYEDPKLWAALEELDKKAGAAA